MVLPVLPVQAEVSFMRYLEATASQGEAESEFVLGVAYRDGWDGTIQPESSIACWCQLADELGDHRPAFLLGQLQKENDRISKDETKAMKCLNDAAESGDNYARVILGEMLLEGRGVPVDWHRGSDWIRKSALAGFAPAQFRLGILYMIGDTSLPKNDVEALAWFIVAAESGSKPAQDMRDERTRLVGQEVARLAILRSRDLRSKDAATPGGGPKARSKA